MDVGGRDAVPFTGGKERVTAWVSVETPHRVLKVALAQDTGRPNAPQLEEFGNPVVAESPDRMMS